jgi:Peptidase family M41
MTIHPRTMRQAQLTRTAYHEAGHAVMAHLVHRRILTATIVPNPDDGTLGHCACGPVPAFNPDRRWDSRTRHTAERLIRIQLAGGLAEKVYTGRHYWTQADRDLRAAYQLAHYAMGEGKGLELYMRWMRHDTEVIIRHPWNWLCIEAVAGALLEHRTLSGRALRAIILTRRREIYDRYAWYEARIEDLQRRVAAFDGTRDAAVLAHGAGDC